MFSSEFLVTENHEDSSCGGIKKTFVYTRLMLWREIKAKNTDFAVADVFMVITIMFKTQDCTQNQFITVCERNKLSYASTKSLPVLGSPWATSWEWVRSGLLQKTFKKRL